MICILSLFAFVSFVLRVTANLHSGGGRTKLDNGEGYHVTNPYDQYFPDCTVGKNSASLITKSKLKVLVCPMIKDEEGYLSEFVAYYKVHGFSHVTFFDDGSTDHFMEELAPWIKTGFGTVRHNETVHNMRGTRMKNPFMKAMSHKAVLETRCMKDAIALGYDYYLSVDLDEYVVPAEPDITFVDMIQKWSDKSGRRMFCMMKANFASTPHIAEPVHLLQIEAYQTRFGAIGRMNHYTSVAKKCMYKLKDPDYHANTPDFIAECCHFHGCGGDDFTTASSLCKQTWHNNSALVYGVLGKNKRFHHLGRLNHYSRSLEKFALKAATWTTASGETATVNDYNLGYFLHRSAGFTTDISALHYSCAVRRVLREVTGEDRFLRYGDQWYRNIEFGKNVSDPSKRGRYGNAKTERVLDGNPFMYEGVHPPGKQAKGWF